MFIIQPGTGLGFSGSKEIALGLGTALEAVLLFPFYIFYADSHYSAVFDEERARYLRAVYRKLEFSRSRPILHSVLRDYIYKRADMSNVFRAKDRKEDQKASDRGTRFVDKRRSPFPIK